MRFVVRDGDLEACIKKWNRLGIENRYSVRARSSFVGPSEARRNKRYRAARKSAKRAGRAA
jgi:ribosomal protein S21